MIRAIAGHELSCSRLGVHYLAPDPEPMTLALRDVAGAVAAAVERLGSMPYWLSCGTLLGLVRDGGAIDGDTDIDICIDADWDDPPEYDDLRAAFGGGEYTAIRELTYDGRPCGAIFFDVARRVYIDVMHQYRNFDPGYSWLFGSPASLKLPEHFIVDRRELDTPWGSFMAPYPVEEYLACHYGPNWKTPEGTEGSASWWSAACREPW